MKRKVVILGAGGHAKVVVDCINKDLFQIMGFLDKDNEFKGENIIGYPILGSDTETAVWLNMGITDCIVGLGHLGNPDVRNKIYAKYKDAGFNMITAVHPSAVVSENAEISEGTVVFPNAVINSGARIGENVIVNSGVVVEHDVVIENGVHLSPRSVVLGNCRVGRDSFLGAGSIIKQGVNVGKRCIVGAGSVVIRDIEDEKRVVGIPSRYI